MAKVAVILSGCGRYDGTETKEAVLTLLAIDKLGATYQCFAPNETQPDVINHLNAEPVTGQTRNMLEEAARIPHEPVLPLNDFEADNFDALILPGGYGAAKALSTFASQGAQSSVHPLVKEAIAAMRAQSKPVGFICIAPTLIPQLYPAGVKMTIGNDPEVSAACQAMGAAPVECDARNIVVDARYKVASTPAYMVASKVHEAAEGIEKLVAQLLAWVV